MWNVKSWYEYSDRYRGSNMAVIFTVDFKQVRLKSMEGWFLHNFLNINIVLYCNWYLISIKDFFCKIKIVIKNLQNMSIWLFNPIPADKYDKWYIIRKLLCSTFRICKKNLQICKNRIFYRKIQLYSKNVCKKHLSKNQEKLKMCKFPLTGCWQKICNFFSQNWVKTKI